MSLPPLGLDLAKLKFNARLVRDGGKLRHKVFANTEAGFAQFPSWLSRQGVERVHACMEAAGADGDALATYLHEAGQVVFQKLLLSYHPVFFNITRAAHD